MVQGRKGSMNPRMIEDGEFGPIVDGLIIGILAT